MASQCLSRSPNQKSYILLFALGQCVGVLPLDFSITRRGNCLRFNWKSFKAVYCFYHLIFQCFVVFSCIYHGTIAGWKFRHIGRTTFYASNLWTTFTLMKLTIKLPSLMKKWHGFDLDMDRNYGSLNGLYKRTIITSLVAYLYAACQISMFFIYNCVRARKISKPNKAEFDIDDFFKLSFPQAVSVFPFSRVIGVLFQLNYIFTYLRMVYTELLISMFSTFLSLRFKQITGRLRSALGKKRNLDFWRETREDYDKICNLCKQTDNQISTVVFASCAGNLLLMLIYLRNCTVYDEINVQKIYNVSAFMILLIRGLLMLLYVAWVNDESKEPTHILNSVSTTEYNSEIQRLLVQVGFDNVAFTGNKMFRLTRTLILNIGGVILTYELALVQFTDIFSAN